MHFSTPAGKARFGRKFPVVNGTRQNSTSMTHTSTKLKLSGAKIGRMVSETDTLVLVIQENPPAENKALWENLDSGTYVKWSNFDKKSAEVNGDEQLIWWLQRAFRNFIGDKIVEGNLVDGGARIERTIIDNPNQRNIIFNGDTLEAYDPLRYSLPRWRWSGRSYGDGSARVADLPIPYRRPYLGGKAGFTSSAHCHPFWTCSKSMATKI